MDLTLLIPLIIGIIGPLVTYILAAKKFSGKIKTTEATELWEEAGKLRREYKAEIDQLRRQLREYEERLTTLDNRNRELYRENGKLRSQLEQHERTIAEMNLKMLALDRENRELRLENVTLRRRITELEEANGK